MLGKASKGTTSYGQNTWPVAPCPYFADALRKGRPVACCAVMRSPFNPGDAPKVRKAAPAGDVLAVLRVRDSSQVLTKRHTTTGTVGYSKAWAFDVQQHPVADLADLADALRWLATQPRLCVVRGKLTEGRNEAYDIRRTYRAAGSNLERADHRWLCVDLDDAPSPDWLDPTDPDSLRASVRWAIRTYLPKCFHKAACAYQWSSSAGVKPWSVLRLHLWFWLARPVCDPSIKPWLKGIPHIDGALYQPVQPHYTAAPIFEGLPDPIQGARVGLLDGGNVEVPASVVDLAAWEANESQRQERARREQEQRKAKLASGKLTLAGCEGDARAELDRACAAIQSTPHGQRHEALRGQAWRIGSFVNAGLLSRAEAFDALEVVARGLDGADPSNYLPTINSGLDNAPAHDLTKFAKPTPNLEPPTDNEPPPPTDADAPHGLHVVPEAPIDPIDPHWPAPTGDRDAELAKQREATARWVVNGTIRKRVESELAARKATMLDAEGLAGRLSDEDLTPWRDKLEAERAEELAKVRAQVTELLCASCKLTGYRAKRAAKKIAKLERKAEQLAGVFSVRAEVRKRKAAIARQARIAALKALGIDKLPVNGERVLVTGAQGTGKSTDALRAIAAIKDPTVNVALFVPTIERAKETASEYQKQHGLLPVRVVLGRGATDPQSVDGEKMCPRHEVVEAAAAAGVNIMKAICGRCQFAESCGYMRQLDELGNLAEAGGALYILAHAYAVLPPPRTLAKPDLVIVDESILPTMAGDVSFAPDRITSQVLPMRAQRIAPGFESTMQLVRAAITKAPGRELADLRERGVTLDELRQAKRALDEAAEETLELSGTLTDAEIARRLSEYEANEAGKIALLLRQIIREWNTGRDGLNSVTCEANATVDVDGKAERQSRVLVSYLKAFRLGTKRPVLALDGTGNLELNKRIFGRRLKETKISIERNAEVVQVKGKSFATGTITGCAQWGTPLTGAPASRANRLRQQIAKVITEAPGERKLVVTTKRVRDSAFGEELAKIPGVILAHFNALRGVNAYEACDVAFIIGREEPPAASIERLAGAYAATDPEPLERIKGQYPKQQRGRRMRDGTGQGEATPVHPDPRCQAVLEQIREAEICQALDRLRLIFKGPKDVYLLTSLPLDVTVDRSVRWGELVQGETRLDLALAALPTKIQAVTPAKLAELCNTSERQERRRLSNVFKGANREAGLTDINAYIYIGKDVRKSDPKRSSDSSMFSREDFSNPPATVSGLVPKGWFAVEFLRPGRSGKPTRSLVRVDAEPYSALEALVGPVAWVRLAGQSDPLPRPPEALFTASENSPPEALVPEVVRPLVDQVHREVFAEGGAPMPVVARFAGELTDATTLAEVNHACHRFRLAARAERPERCTMGRAPTEVRQGGGAP